MHLSEESARAAQALRLQENLLERLEKGREWATPAIESALRRALAGIDNGIDVASPRLQANLRAIAEELAGGVETVTPRLHERIARMIPDATPPLPAVSERRKPWHSWWILGAVLAAAVGGVALWRIFRQPDPSAEPQSEQGAEKQPVQAEAFVANPLRSETPPRP